jgi:hypothetical protein
VNFETNNGLKASRSICCSSRVVVVVVVAVLEADESRDGVGGPHIHIVVVGGRGRERWTIPFVYLKPPARASLEKTLALWSASWNQNHPAQHHAAIVYSSTPVQCGWLSKFKKASNRDLYHPIEKRSLISQGRRGQE